MSTKKKLLEAAAGAAAGEAVYVDDVFSTYLYTGTQSAMNITNGIDLDGEGGLVWIKRRGTLDGSHYLWDTERGSTKMLSTNTTNAEISTDSSWISSFNSDGFSIGNSGSINNTSYDEVSWTFRKQPGFFDVVTFSASGSSQTNRRISHNLGSVPGMIIIKRTSGTGAWFCYHRSTGVNSYLILNMTAAESTGANWWGTAPTSTDFGINEATLGISGDYVAYLFAHDAQDFGTNSNESIIKCGSYTGNSSTTGPVIDLGWEPQFIFIKNTDFSGTEWVMLDSMRGIVTGNNDAILKANATAAEFDFQYLNLTSTGFQLTSTSSYVNLSGDNYVYMAIRRPHKPAEEFAATDLFEMDTGANTAPGLVSDFPVDFSFSKEISYSNTWFVGSRLQGQKYMSFASTSTESTRSEITWDYMNGFMDSSFSGEQGWMFRRTPGFFDVVSYTGTGSTGTHTHNLGVVPELMIVKGRSVGSNWAVYAAPLGNTKLIELDGTGAAWTNSIWGNTTPTASVATIGGAANLSGSTYIAYLFATVPGISKVGSYTGTGSNVDVDCGFTSGARFVLIKRTDDSGSWFLYDSARGIVSGNDPYLRLQSNSAQGTGTDYIDPLSSGFTINSGADLGLNASGGSYIFLAIA